MNTIRQFRNRYLAISDFVLLTLAVSASFVLRLETFNWGGVSRAVLFFASLALVITPLTFYLFGIYSRYWQYASVDEMLLMVTATTVATLIVSIVYIAGGFLIFSGFIFPRSIPFIYFPFALAVTISPRFAIRLISQRRRRMRQAMAFGKGRTAPLKNVLIVGAGDAGSMIGREIQNNPDLGMELIGFLDDDLHKLRAYIH
ncbi:MAG TPA: polysaccharide biosynthesis protein, partial [Anaerolineae bacterium]|nr:polysaccharide biosynthesis protein [Anaerolineae bacterium]